MGSEHDGLTAEVAAREVKTRLGALREHLERSGATLYITADPDNQTYFAGFRALLYSRPIILVVSERSSLIVPELEASHAEQYAAVDQVFVYGERPESHWTSHEQALDHAVGGVGADSVVAVDSWQLPLAISELLTKRGLRLTAVDRFVRELRALKSTTELKAIHAAGAVVNVGVAAAVAACVPGASELEVDAAGARAIHEAAGMLGPTTVVETLVMTPSGAARTTLPHVFSSARTLQERDVLIHTRQVALNGYRAELERTLIVGAPTPEQRAAFEVMVDAQDAALEAVCPGVPACEVDAAARDVFRRAGLSEYALHRTGHGIGIGAHEHPHLRFDNRDELRSGMVITIEPGAYIPGLGGFRHSDTIVVTERGYELVTSHPRRLDELTRLG